MNSSPCIGRLLLSELPRRWNEHSGVNPLMVNGHKSDHRSVMFARIYLVAVYSAYCDFDIYIYMCVYIYINYYIDFSV